MFFRRFLRCTFCFAIILCSTSAFAQKQFGSAQGTVHDAEGQPIPGTSVVVSSESQGSTAVYTDKSGRYRIESLIPGTYKLEAHLVDFQPVVKVDVRISAGSTSTVDFVLEPEKVAESVIVYSKTPALIDSTTTAVSHTVLPEIIQGLPQRQDFRALLALTPGVGDDGAAYGGSPNTSNRVWIDGVNVSNASSGGIFNTGYDYNWIEEVQVVGNGAPAEYGNYSGVIGNFVTRSGGNQFHGLLETFFHNENLVSTNAPNPGPEIPFHSWDLSTQIGGPITRDKLWFFSGFQYLYTQNTPFGYSGVQTDEVSNFITKLTYKPNQNNAIQGFAQYRHNRFDGDGADFEVLPEVTTVNTCDVSSWNATWSSILTTDTTLEGRLGGFWGRCELLPRNGDISAFINDNTGVQSRNATHSKRNSRFQPQGNLALTHYAQNYLGNHEFKFGVQLQSSRVRDESSINGGFIYHSYYDSNDGYTSIIRYSYLQDTNKFNGNIDQISLYVHDTWNLNSRFTLSLGLRWDHYRGSTDRGVVLSSDPVAPRIGLIWNIREEKPIVIKAHYGDYYDVIRTGNFDLLSNQPFGGQDHVFDNTTQQWEPDYHEQTVYSSASNIKHPFVRQFIVGMDQELPAGVAAGVHYIYRRWHNILEDVDTNTVYEPVPFTNPVTGELITVFSRPPNNVSYTLLTNPEGLYRTYDGLEVYLNRRFLNQLALSSSFVYSKTRGNVPNGQGVISSSFSQFLNDPNQLINFTGHLVNDPAFAWKVSGIYDFPHGINFGFFFRHESGDTWEPLVDLPETVLQGGTIFGLPRGSNRLPSQNILDLRIEKQLAMLSGQFRVTADIFNVFNAGTAIGVNSNWESHNYGRPTSLMEPRIIRLGLRYTF